MTLGSKEHYEIIEMFEKLYAEFGIFEKTEKSDWSTGEIYSDEKTNSMFIMFRHGVSFGKVL